MELMKEIPNESIDCIITSPPYNKSFFSKQKKTNQIWSGFEIKYSTYSDDMPIEEYENWMIDFINMCLDKLKPNGSLFFNHKPIRHNNQVYFPLNFNVQKFIIVFVASKDKAINIFQMEMSKYD